MSTVSTSQNFGSVKTTYGSTTYCENTPNDPNEHLPPSAVITGQPGVGERCASLIDVSFSNILIPKGKTFWILYAVRRRLGEAKPFLWYTAMRWYLFVQGGVFHSLPWLFEFQLVCSLTLGVYRFERLSTRLSDWGFWAAIQTLHHIRYISPTTSMAGPNAEYISESFDHESLDVGRDRQSVNFLTFMSSSLADHPVPLVPTSIISQSPSAHMPKRYSWNMCPFLDSAPIMSKIHPNYIWIKRNLT